MGHQSNNLPVRQWEVHVYVQRSLFTFLAFRREIKLNSAPSWTIDQELKHGRLISEFFWVMMVVEIQSVGFWPSLSAKTLLKCHGPTHPNRTLLHWWPVWWKSPTPAESQESSQYRKRKAFRLFTDHEGKFFEFLLRSGHWAFWATVRC